MKDVELCCFERSPPKLSALVLLLILLPLRILLPPPSPLLLLMLPPPLLLLPPPPPSFLSSPPPCNSCGGGRPRRDRAGQGSAERAAMPGDLAAAVCRVVRPGGLFWKSDNPNLSGGGQLCCVLFWYVLSCSVLLCSATLCSAAFCHVMLCYVLFSSVMLVEGAGGGTLGDHRWTWGSGGRGMQCGRVGWSALKI